LHQRHGCFRFTKNPRNAQNKNMILRCTSKTNFVHWRSLWAIKSFLETRSEGFETSERVDELWKIRKLFRFPTIPFWVSESSETLSVSDGIFRKPKGILRYLFGYPINFYSSIGNRKGILRYLFGYPVNFYGSISTRKYLYGFRGYLFGFRQ
jgi:hypothetical protein